jgi:hypothetical protein
MNRSTQGLCSAGTLFLRMTRLLFAEHTVATVFLPAVADFQNELQEASSGRVADLVARCRWYWALTTLLVVTPFSVSIPSIARRERGTEGDSLFMLLYISLFAGAWWCVQAFMGTAILAGVILAVAMRAWNDRHPAVSAIGIRVATVPFVEINDEPGQVAELVFAARTPSADAL